MYNEFAFFAKGKMLKATLVNNEKELKRKEVEKMDEHILDQLEKLLKGKTNLNAQQKELEVKIIASKLKEMSPEKFEEAYNHPDPKHCLRQRLALAKEFAKMKEQGVWRKILKS